jgi:hypothetical protein
MKGICNALGTGFGNRLFGSTSIGGAAVTGLFLLVVLCCSQMSAQSLYTMTSPLSDGSTSGIRMPNGTIEHAYHRAVLLVDGASLRLLPAGTNITRLGFVLSKGAGAKVSGTMTLYLSNTPTTTRDLNTVWSDIIAGMTRVYSGPFTIPDTTGPVDVVLSAPFQYTGRSMYAAYEFQSSGPFTEQNAVFSSNVTLSMSMRSGFSSKELPAVLNDVSDFRPVMRFGFLLPATQWNSVASGTSVDFNGIDIVDDVAAWLCAGAGNVFRTTDLGSTWIDAGSVQDSSITILGLAATVGLTIAGKETETSSFYLTFDGSSWSKVNDPDLTIRVAVAGKTSATSLWCLGAAANDSVALLTSNDQGRSWAKSQTGVVMEQGVRISRGSGFRIGSAVWFGTRGSGAASGRVYRSSTGPIGPWRFSSTGRANIVALAFSSATGTGVAGHAGSIDTISRSADGGATWSAVAVPGLGEVMSLQFYAGGQDVWAASSTGIWWSADGGLSWQKSFASGSCTFSSLRFSPNSQSALAVGSSGLIVKGAWVKTPLAGVSHSSSVPNEYWLGANYPNPFNASTWVEYSVPLPSYVDLKLIDILGREIATLVSGETGAGRFKVQWNAGQNPSGVYFCRLLARPSTGAQVKQYIQTQKLVLIK